MSADSAAGPGPYCAGAGVTVSVSVTDSLAAAQHSDHHHGQGESEAADWQHEVPVQDGALASIKIHPSVSIQDRNHDRVVKSPLESSE